MLVLLERAKAEPAVLQIRQALAAITATMVVVMTPVSVEVPRVFQEMQGTQRLERLERLERPVRSVGTMGVSSADSLPLRS